MSVKCDFFMQERQLLTRLQEARARREEVCLPACLHDPTSLAALLLTADPSSQLEVGQSGTQSDF